MHQYSYSAKTLSNETVKGTLSALDEVDLLRRLRQKNLYPLTYKNIDDNVKIYRLKAKELSDFSRQVGSMISSGVPMIKTLEIVKNRDLKVKVKNVYNELYHTVLEGTTLATAMSELGGAFPDILINMFKSGEASGKLDDSAFKMAEYYEKEYRLNSKIRTAMAYPGFLLILTIAVVLIIFTLVLPTFFDLFEGMELPLMTKIVIAISNAITSYWIVLLIGTLMGIALLIALLRQPHVVLFLDEKKLKIIGVKKLLKIIYTARFARTISSLYVSGLSMIHALEIAATVIGNKYVEKQFYGIIQDVKNGEPLSKAMKNMDGFDSKLLSALEVGEETGKLDYMLETMASSYEYEAEMATTKLVAYIEPIMIIIMAIVIGFVMLSVFLPLMDIYNNIG